MEFFSTLLLKFEMAFELADLTRWNWIFLGVGGASLLFALIITFQFVFGQLNKYGRVDNGPSVAFPAVFFGIGTIFIIIGLLVNFE